MPQHLHQRSRADDSMAINSVANHWFWGGYGGLFRREEKYRAGRSFPWRLIIPVSRFWEVKPMIKDYLIVNKKILPDYYSVKVVEARILMESSQCKSVSRDVSKLGISHRTYYKYKDYIFTPSENYGRKFTLSFKLDDQPGIPFNILNILRDHQTSIITIHRISPSTRPPLWLWPWTAKIWS